MLSCYLDDPILVDFALSPSLPRQTRYGIWVASVGDRTCNTFRSTSLANNVHHSMALTCAPPKTNMEPKDGGLEDDFPFQTADFQVPC